jgi:allantoate deiminase
MEVLPGAVNVIPGRVKFTVDVRSPVDADRDAAVRQIKAAISAARNCEASVSVTHTAKAVPCDQRLIESFSQAISAEGYALHALPSGAGHDAMVMAEVWPVGMVFVRCAGGISHNPAEDATADDLGAGAAVLLRAVRALRI